MTYFEKLKDPRWQKKRLERLDMADFACENCGNKDEELSVHHRYYKKNTDPWDYNDDDLVVFCKTCHSSWHDAKQELNVIIGRINTAEQLQRVAGYALAINEDVFPIELDTMPHLVGYADAFRTNVDVVKYLMREAIDKGWPLSPGVLLSRQMVD